MKTNKSKKQPKPGDVITISPRPGVKQKCEVIDVDGTKLKLKILDVEFEDIDIST